MTVITSEESYDVGHGSNWIEHRHGMEMTDATSPNQIAENFTPFPAEVEGEMKIAFDSEVEPEIEIFRWDEERIIDEFSLDEQTFVLPEQLDEVIS